MLLSAGNTPANDIALLPWWAQLLIGVALIVVAAAMHHFGKKIESDIMDMASFLLGCGGLYALVTALF
ncbi:hypothetical protein [Streptomyces violaceusniger]|uniref:Uncharacterized protein n=1 Tax=Streptomyces violaceusniger (strain Tu 4113) TaxID=653045 RepID=G2PHU2_STRV4|nr:hypothetical protein [Streptomyces violaceusniger]AEM88893.1 hypothetical protein Strvi_0117 [Streptomyces violaceusniger Tu 4113]